MYRIEASTRTTNTCDFQVIQLLDIDSGQAFGGKILDLCVDGIWIGGCRISRGWATYGPCVDRMTNSAAMTFGESSDLASKISWLACSPTDWLSAVQFQSSPVLQ